MDEMNTPIGVWLVRKTVFDEKIVPQVHDIALEPFDRLRVGHVVLEGVGEVVGVAEIKIPFQVDGCEDVHVSKRTS